MDVLERNHALQLLDTALRDASRGQGCLVLVSGEAGIGKTTLVNHFSATQRELTRVLWGACDALFAAHPLGPLRDIAVQTGGRLLQLMLDEATPSLLLSACLHELQQRPSLLVIEDIHWADEATLDLIKFLGRRMQRTPSVLIVTYRDDELDVRHPLRLLLGDLSAAAVIHRIALAPLSERAVRQMVGDRPLDAAALHQRTGGNPFFVAETIANETAGIPVSVRDAVLTRAARLSVAGRAVLDAAAVIGPRIEPRLLAAVTQAPMYILDECIDNGMLIGQGDMLVFRHELVRQTILESIAPHRQEAWHRLILARLEMQPTARSEVARLAHHAEAAHDRAAVWEYAPAAARRAAAASAHHAAMAHYARVLRFADGLPPEDHAHLLEAYAHECIITERVAEAIAARQQANELWRTLDRPLRQGENLARLAALYAEAGQADDAETACHDAIRVLVAQPAGRELGTAYRVAGTLCLLRDDLAESIVWSEQAIALAERFGDTDTLAMAYNMIGSALMPTDFARGCHALEQSISIARQAGNDLRVATAYANLGSCAAEIYQFAAAERYLDDGVAFAREHDLDTPCSYMQAWQALLYLHTGRWAAAAELTTSVLASADLAPFSRIMVLAVAGRLRARRGEPGADALLDEALELAIQMGYLLRLGTVYSARAEAAWLAHDSARLRSAAQAVYDLAYAKKHAWFVGELGRWRWYAGEQITLPNWAARPYTLQLAGDWHSAADWWAELGCPYEQALALMDGDDAAQTRALNIFAQLGAHPAAELVRERLETRSPRQRERAAFGGLTARERDAAALIAAGYSNRAIAATMGVSNKTIETYVTRILGKLGFDSRVQIATWAIEKGLVQPARSRGG